MSALIFNIFLNLFLFINAQPPLTSTCPPNEHYSCSCDKTCSEPFKVCTLACISFQCVCEVGFLRSNNGTCIPKDQCPNLQCPPGQTFTSCGSSPCKNTCKQKTIARRCKAPCKPGCGCEEGKVWHNGRCIPVFECPPTKCDKDCLYWHDGCNECECRNGTTANCGWRCDHSFTTPQCKQCPKGVDCPVRKALKENLARARSVWSRYRQENYQYTIQHQAFISACSAEKMLVYVENGKVVRVDFSNKQSGKKNCDKESLKYVYDLKSYFTIDQLFDKLAVWADSYDRLTVQYSNQGFPKYISADPMNGKYGPVDDEFTKEISCLSFPTFNALQCDGTKCGSDCICRIPARVGRCKSAIKRYFYNKLSGKCEQFVFGGCDGNDNNFGTKLECEKMCVKPKPCSGFNQCSHKMCSGTHDAVCVCDIFGKCESYWNKCWACCKNRGRDQKHILSIRKGSCSKCQLPKQEGFCHGFYSRYFYNMKEQRCQRFLYGGCGGNANNFMTKEQCEFECRPSISVRV